MQLSELCGIITPPTNPFNPIITQQVNPLNPLNPLFTYRKQRCSPTDLTDFWVRRINNGFIGLNGFLGASKGVHLSPLGFAACQSKKCTNRAISAPTGNKWMPFALLVQLRQLHPLKNAVCFVEGVSKLPYYLKNHKALTFTSQGFAMSKSCCNVRP